VDTFRRSFVSKIDTNGRRIRSGCWFAAQRLRVAAAQRGVEQHEFVTEAVRQAIDEHEAAEEKRRRGR
jgi:hypothetical protein